MSSIKTFCSEAAVSYHRHSWSGLFLLQRFEVQSAPPHLNSVRAGKIFTIIYFGNVNYVTQTTDAKEAFVNKIRF
jgi:hypothetical protein